MRRREEKIKRQLLRQLVDENVDLRENRPPRLRRRRQPVRPLVALALLVPIALLASTLLLAAVVDGGALGDSPSPGELPSAGVADGPAIVAPPTPRRSQPAQLAQEGPRAARPDLAELPRSVDADVFPLAVRKIVLDPGHGGANPGTRTPDGLEEKFLTLDIARRVREALADEPFEVLLTRDADESVTLEDRAELANRERADIFVSIHVNWLEGSRASGIETYYLGPTDDPFLNRLARDENRDSGHSMAELRDLLEGVYAGVRVDKSAELARAVHGSLYRSLARVNPVLTDRGVKTAPFIVLVDTDMPAILAEVAALSSETEAAMLAKPLYRQHLAEALADGLRSYARGSRAERAAPAPRGADTT